jgi:integrase
MPRPNAGPRLKWVERRRSFYVCYYEGGQQRLRATGTADRREAEIALSRWLDGRRAAERTSGPRDPGELLIADVLDVYGRDHAPHTDDPARIGYAITALLPFWGSSSVSAITKATCRRYARERGVADGTIRRELGTLRAALNFAHSEGLLTQMVPIELPRRPPARDRWLTKKEAAALLNAARTGRGDVRMYLPLFILLGLYTGARKGAILSLRWPQIDFARERIDFAKGEKVTNKGRAHIPIPDRLLTFLRLAYKRRSSDIGYVVHLNGRRIKDIGDSGNGSFGGACERAGLDDVSPHTLRHTCGTWMAQGGTDLWDIAGWLGHSLAETTELYAHHHPDYKEKARRAVDRRK